MSKPQRFRAVLEPDGTGLRWVIARVPFDPAGVWKQRRGMRVQGTINGFAFRTSLFGSSAAGHVLLVNKSMQKGAGAKVGDLAEILLEPDLAERASTVPPELARLLKQDRALGRFYEELSPSARRDIGQTIIEPKSADARQRRAEQAAERMLLAMEGEQRLPPVLQVAFRRCPRAEQGWQVMTPVQRRGHLLGIFYYQSPEARERRAQKVVIEAVRIASQLT